MGVASEVFEEMLAIAERPFGVDVPAHSMESVEELLEDFGIGRDTA